MQKSKILVANRGEICVRVLRAAYELSMSTVAIYSEEDRLAGHHQKADAAYLIGRPGEFGSVEAYLQSKLIAGIAQNNNVTLIHPGYGFLSENATFASIVRDMGMKFVGPPTEVIEKMGDKVTARKIAKQCGIPTVPGTDGPLQSMHEAYDFITRNGYPVIVKANFGGGGRGMRVVHDTDSIEDAVAAAKSEASASFGNGSVFLERFLQHPKHVEVQVLSDIYGNHVHLFERDCSVQRRHQKVIEIAPSPKLSSMVREAILQAAIDLVKYLKYENAGTVEFLVEGENYYFIEMNPRIQVEHTVTEEITGIDIVKAQLQIACGHSLPSLGLTQETISRRGSAIQCRITTEIPSQGFRPDSGRIERCCFPTGHGIRLDYSNFYQGAQISPFYDSLLVKCTSSGRDLEAARKKALRALQEFQIKGVETNIDFLIRILEHPTFMDGSCSTTFIDEAPELLVPDIKEDHAHKLLQFLGNAAVNGSMIVGQMKPPGLDHDITISPLVNPHTGEELDTSKPCTEGWRNILLEHGPQEFANIIRAHKDVLISDTTWRDGQQSLLATRVRTRDLMAIAKPTSHAYSNAYSLECWGGATFDVALRFLYECPWERLSKLRKLVPLPDNAIYHFVKIAKDCGVDIFRVFDCLNNIDNLEVGISAALAAGGVVEGAIMYTGDMMKPGKYSLEYYMGIADKLVELGSHIIAIKSMSGVMKPAAGRRLVRAIRTKYPDIPIHMHTHDTNGTGVATMLACVEEGADIIDTAIDSISGSTSQPAVSSTLGALENTGFDAALDLDQIGTIDAYWAQLRLMYTGFDADLRSPDPTIYKHEIPGGQYSNLMFQARQLGLGSQWQETQQAYEEANHLLGGIVKATPTSKAVGDLAQFMVDRKLSAAEVLKHASTLDFPVSVLDYFEGLMGQPFDGFPEPFRTNALRNQRPRLTCRPGLTLSPVDFEGIRRKIHAEFPEAPVTDQDVASYVMYPEVYLDFRKARQKFGDVTDLRTPIFLTAPRIGQGIAFRVDDGKEIFVEMVSVGLVDTDTAMRDVLFRLDGELCSVQIKDSKATPKQSRPKANPQAIGETAAPMTGKVVRTSVKKGDTVVTGQILLALTAMKMEVNISADINGTASDISVSTGDTVEKGDLLVRLVPKSQDQPNGNEKKRRLR